MTKIGLFELQSDWTLDHSNHAAQQDLSECISATGAIMLQARNFLIAVNGNPALI